MKKRKRTVGRPSKGRNARTIAVIVKVSANERAVWLKQAKAEGLPLGPWLLKPRRDELQGGK
ncbi:MAG: hypothetical protein ABSE73_14225 [Planctomycetota bacterium]